MEEFARAGTLKVPMQLNELMHGLWEIKAGDVRIAFFYTKHDARTVVRLCNGFIKAQQKTPRHEIDIAKWIRREDEAV